MVMSLQQSNDTVIIGSGIAMQLDSPCLFMLDTRASWEPLRWVSLLACKRHHVVESVSPVTVAKRAF